MKTKLIFLGLLLALAFSFSAPVHAQRNNEDSNARTITLKIETTTLPSATEGKPYTVQFQVEGGTAPYTWSVSTGNLPAGLTLDPAKGTLTGTPKVTGRLPKQFSFTIEVKDSAHHVGRAQFEQN